MVGEADRRVDPPADFDPIPTHIAARLLGLKPNTLRKGRCKSGKGLIVPPSYKIGNRVLYDRLEVEAWRMIYPPGPRAGK